MKPIALSCGEPAGIGPEIAVAARVALGDSLPFFWIGDPRHLPRGTAMREISRAEDALSVPATVAIVVTYEVATIATMVTLVAVARAGVARLRGPRVERWTASAAGASIAVTGIAVALLGW